MGKAKGQNAILYSIAHRYIKLEVFYFQEKSVRVSIAQLLCIWVHQI